MYHSSTGNPRGYYVLRKRSGLEKPALLFKTVSPEDSPTFHKGWLRIFKHALVPWHEWMQSLDVSSFKNGAVLQEAIRYLLLRMMSLKCTGNDLYYVVNRNALMLRRFNILRTYKI